MKTKTLRQISVRLTAILLLFTSLFSATVIPVRAEPAAPDRDWPKYERRILKVIMNHHLYELEIARLCLSQAAHSELISLCQTLVSSLPQEISTLQAWLQSWYGESYRPRLNLTQKSVLRHLSLTRLKGAKFEIQSMKIYRQLFREGASTERTCSRRAPHAELAAYCDQDVTTMSQNFIAFTQWLCNWYERCYGGTRPNVAEWQDW